MSAPVLSAAARAYLDAPLPDEQDPWRSASFAVVDLETTGLDPEADEIISFACVPVEHGRVAVGGATSLTVRPERMPGADSIRIHGLREADLVDAPALTVALDSMLEALAGRILVAHAAWVEQGFLTAALRRAGVRLRGPAIDTAALAARVPPRVEHAGAARAAPADTSPGLSHAAWGMGLPIHRPHHADGDALTTAQLFISLATQLELREPQTVGSLVRLSHSSRG